MERILIVGQTPPPFGGQAIMIDEIRKICSPFDEVNHIRMTFSKDMDSIGKFKLSKIYELFRIIFSIWVALLYKRPRILYYPPAGDGAKIALYRDFMILSFTRFFFKKTIFHFHAGGIADYYERLNFIEKFLYRIAYFTPDLSIIMSKNAEKDPLFIKSKKIEVIPHGLEDEYQRHFLNKIKNVNIPLQILFVGVVRESKGVLILLEACKILLDKGISFKLNIIGKYESDTFKSKVENFILSNHLENKVVIHGVKSGIKKFELFFLSDIFCFPSHFESENFPVVLMESMMFSLPIISTDWRGISDMIVNNQNGLLCPIQDPNAISLALEKLIKDPVLRIELGKKGRMTFEQKYTNPIFKKNILETFENI